MGTKRGKCQEDGCKGCPRYRPADDVGEGGGPCLFCGHFPGNHENLGRCNESGKHIKTKKNNFKFYPFEN